MTRLSVFAALDENDRSFCEDVHTTEYYHELREETDDSIWCAEYMQEPIEAIGLLYPKSELNRFKLADIEGKATGWCYRCYRCGRRGRRRFLCAYC